MSSPSRPDPALPSGRRRRRFTDVSSAAGVEVVNPATGAPMAKSLGLRLVDLDADGLLDVIVGNDTV